MLIKKMLLAAAAVMALAAPAAAMAQDYGGYHDGGRYSQRYEGRRYDTQRRDFAWRQVEREGRMRQPMWRAPSEQRSYDGGSHGYRADGHRSY